MKDSVIKMLIENIGRPLSGQVIAQALGVSRNAVWKAMNELKKSGFEISSTTNTGYVLNRVDQICLPMIERFLSAKANITVLETVDSSNNYAKANLYNDWDVVIAKSQSAGKGRLGRSFFSPIEGVYMSVVLRESIGACDSRDSAFGLRNNSVWWTVATSVAVTRAIEIVTGLRTEIKWVNDIFVGGRKVCGILTEGSVDLETGTIESAVVGIGINCGEMVFPQEINMTAATIGNVDRNNLIAEVINQMKEVFGNSGGAANVMSEYRAKSMLLGKTVECVGRGISGKAIAIDDNGQLIIENDSGQLALNSGEVSVRLV